MLNSTTIVMKFCFEKVLLFMDFINQYELVIKLA